MLPENPNAETFKENVSLPNELHAFRLHLPCKIFGLEMPQPGVGSRRRKIGSHEKGND